MKMGAHFARGFILSGLVQIGAIARAETTCLKDPDFPARVEKLLNQFACRSRSLEDCSMMLGVYGAGGLAMAKAALASSQEVAEDASCSIASLESETIQKYVLSLLFPRAAAACPSKAEFDLREAAKRRAAEISLERQKTAEELAVATKEVENLNGSTGGAAKLEAKSTLERQLAKAKQDAVGPRNVMRKAYLLSECQNDLALFDHAISTLSAVDGGEKNAGGAGLVARRPAVRQAISDRKHLLGLIDSLGEAASASSWQEVSENVLSFKRQARKDLFAAYDLGAQKELNEMFPNTSSNQTIATLTDQELQLKMKYPIQLPKTGSVDGIDEIYEAGESAAKEFERIQKSASVYQEALGKHTLVEQKAALEVRIGQLKSVLNALGQQENALEGAKIWLGRAGGVGAHSELKTGRGIFQAWSALHGAKIKNMDLKFEELLANLSEQERVKFLSMAKVESTGPWVKLVGKLENQLGRGVVVANTNSAARMSAGSLRRAALGTAKLSVAGLGAIASTLAILDSGPAAAAQVLLGTEGNQGCGEMRSNCANVDAYCNYQKDVLPENFAICLGMAVDGKLNDLETDQKLCDMINAVAEDSDISSFALTCNLPKFTLTKGSRSLLFENDAKGEPKNVIVNRTYQANRNQPAQFGLLMDFASVGVGCCTHPEDNEICPGMLKETRGPAGKSGKASSR